MPGLAETVTFLDRLKDFGFRFATMGGVSIGIEDLEIPAEKQELLTEADARVFQDELKHILLYQHACFNSPVWFNVGIEEKPQCSACFINSVEDTLESILELAKTEGMLFKYGSGAGSNLSRLRSSKEMLSTGGKPSGPVSFMRGYDAFANVIKSGGKTRRAAKMQILDCDHPDVEEFIWCKAKEEKKAHALIDAGYDGSVNGEAYQSVFFQNSNLSVRETDDFMRAVENDALWRFRARASDDRDERVQAQGLAAHRLEQLVAGQALRIRRERVAQARQQVGPAPHLVDRPGQRRRGGLVAGHHQGHQLLDDLLVVHGLAVLVARGDQQAADVLPRLAGASLVDLLVEEAVHLGHEAPEAPPRREEAVAQEGEAREHQYEEVAQGFHIESPGSRFHVLVSPATVLAANAVVYVGHFRLSLRMRGVTKISSSALLLLFLVSRNNAPKPGMSPRNGTLVTSVDLSNS